MAPSKKTVVHTIYTGDYVLGRINSVLKPFGLTSQQYNVLRILRGQKGECVTLSSIQERMINKSSNTTRLVDKLVLKELVHREVDEENRRKLRICITTKGNALLKKIDPLIEDVETETTSSLNKEEIEMLNTLLEKLRY